MTMVRPNWAPPLWLRPLSDEPPHGAYLRLADRNGICRMRVCENLTGVKLRHVRVGRDLDRLADLLRCDRGLLESLAISHPSPRQYVVAGQVVHPKQVMMTNRRSCPACLVESPHHRFWWDLNFVSSCVLHSIRLVDQCSCGGSLTWADASPAKCHRCEDGDVRNSRAGQVGADVLALDTWIFGRLGILLPLAQVPVIHALPLGRAIEIVERIGSFVIGGYQTNWQEITDFDLAPEEVRAMGFRTLVEGKLNDALDRAAEGFLAANSDQERSIRTMYGWFWHWLCYRGGVKFSAELAALLLQHAQAKIQVSRLAFPSLQRSSHTITLMEAAGMCRMRHGTLRKLLEDEGLIRTSKRKGSPIMISREVAERMARDFADSINREALGKFIGVGGISLSKLVRSGRVPVWMRGGNERKHRYIFRRSEVLDWMRRLIGHPPTVMEIPDGMVTVAGAPLASGLPINFLIDALALGEIRVKAVLVGRPNLGSALVERNAVRSYRDAIGSETAKDPLWKYIKKRA